MARLRELQLDRLEGRVLDAEEVARGWADILRRVKAGMLAVTSRLRAQLPHLTAHDAALIDREIRAALTALADDVGRIHPPSGDHAVTSQAPGRPPTPTTSPLALRPAPAK